MTGTPPLRGREGEFALIRGLLAAAGAARARSWWWRGVPGSARPGYCRLRSARARGVRPGSPIYV